MNMFCKRFLLSFCSRPLPIPRMNSSEMLQTLTLRWSNMEIGNVLYKQVWMRQPSMRIFQPWLDIGLITGSPKTIKTLRNHIWTRYPYCPWNRVVINPGHYISLSKGLECQGFHIDFQLVRVFNLHSWSTYKKRCIFHSYVTWLKETKNKSASAFQVRRKMRFEYMHYDGYLFS